MINPLSCSFAGSYSGSGGCREEGQKEKLMLITGNWSALFESVATAIGFVAVGPIPKYSLEGLTAWPQLFATCGFRVRQKGVGNGISTNRPLTRFVFQVDAFSS